MRLVDLDDYSHTFCGHDGEYEKWNIDPDAIVPAIEPKKGKWIRKVNPYAWRWDTWVCSECGEVTTSTIMGKPRYLWCPMCGADMKEGEA